VRASLLGAIRPLFPLNPSSSSLDNSALLWQFDFDTEFQIQTMNPCLYAILLQLAFTERELRLLLSNAGDELSWSLRAAALPCRVHLLSQRDEALQSLVLERFQRRFEREAAQYAGLSMVNLLERWTLLLPSLHGLALGGLLWAIVQQRAALLPAVQTRLTEDIQCLALCALASQTNRRIDEPRSELPTRDALAAQLLSDQPL
jgi:hypothetical protein